MLNKISKLENTKDLSKEEQKNINGGFLPIDGPRCGGDGSFIYVNGQIVCCWVPRPGWYIC